MVQGEREERSVVGGKEGSEKDGCVAFKEGCFFTALTRQRVRAPPLPPLPHPLSLSLSLYFINLRMRGEGLDRRTRPRVAVNSDVAGGARLSSPPAGGTRF